MRNAIAVAGIILAVTALNSPVAGACYDKNYDQCPDQKHMMVEGGGFTGSHTDCRANTGYHGDCDGFAQSQAIYKSILAAAKAGDVEKVLLLSAKAPDWVLINRERGSVQLFSCTSNTLIANLKLPTTERGLRLAAKVEGQQFDRARLASKVANAALAAGF